MATSGDVYDNPLIGRYASRVMSERWGPLRKFRTWRQLGSGSPRPRPNSGLPADDGEIAAHHARNSSPSCARHLDDIDFARAAEHEKRLRHDVMAHIHALGDVAPGAGDDHPPRRDESATSPTTPT